MIYCCNMIICILLTFISSVQMVDYDDGNPWWDHLLDNQPDADPNRRILWTHLGDSQHHCNEPKASSCSYIRINMNILVHQNWFYLPEEPFSKMKFKRRVTHKLNGQYFAEFEYRQKNLKLLPSIGHFTVVYNYERLFGNIEWKGMKFTISSEDSKFAELKRWQSRWNGTLDSGSRHTMMREAVGNPITRKPM